MQTGNDEKPQTEATTNPTSDPTNGETPTTEHVEQPQPEISIHIPAAHLDNNHDQNKNGVKKKKEVRFDYVIPIPKNK